MVQKRVGNHDLRIFDVESDRKLETADFAR